MQCHSRAHETVVISAKYRCALPIYIYIYINTEQCAGGGGGGVVTQSLRQLIAVINLALD